MSEVKVNKISPRTACGTTTLGDSGDTFTIPAGVTITNNGTQTGFGRTGTVDWETTPKTGDFTGVSGEGYFINTTSGKITMTLPSASAGDIISIQDYNNTFDSYSCVIQAPSGVKINGGTAAGLLTLSTEGQGLTLVYVDGTVGWRSIESTTFSSSSGIPTFITATVSGACNALVTSGDYKTAIFKGPGTFTVCSVGNCAGSTTVEYMVVAGGGGGSFGGGGAGGFRQNYPSPTTAGLPVTATGYPVTVGAAGTGIPCATSGSNSVFTGSTTITSAGGGRGGGANSNVGTGAAGGSGGGGGHGPDVGGAGNTPPVSPVAQGFAGGAGTPGSPGCYYGGGGGGGATSIGTNSTPGSPPANTGGNGGTGNYWPDAVLGPTAPSYGTSGPVSSTRYFAGGGGGSYKGPAKGIGGSGGGGTSEQSSPAVAATPGTTNTGGGGGGGNGAGKAGGSGIVMIRYKFQ